MMIVVNGMEKRQVKLWGAVLAIVVVMAIALLAEFPSTAHAALAGAGDVQASMKVVAQGSAKKGAKMKSVYVVSSTKAKSSIMGVYPKVKYSYNKNGLLVKRANSEKTLETFAYSKKKLKTSWHGGGQGAPCDLTYTYKKGKLAKSSDSQNQNIKLYKLRKDGKVKALTSCSGFSNYSVDTYFKYNKQGKIAGYQYSTWRNVAELISYDAKGNVKKTIEYSNDDRSQYNTTTYKNTYKGKRLTKIVANRVGSNSKNTVSVKYKKIKVPASYASAVKRQQASILQKYASLADGNMGGVTLFGVPLGCF